MNFERLSAYNENDNKATMNWKLYVQPFWYNTQVWQTGWEIDEWIECPAVAHIEFALSCGKEVICSKYAYSSYQIRICRWWVIMVECEWMVINNDYHSPVLCLTFILCSTLRDDVHWLPIRQRIMYKLSTCLVGTGSVVLVDQTTDGSTRFVATPATSPRRYGDQPFFVAIAQEWRNGPRRLREHDDDDADWRREGQGSSAWTGLLCWWMRMIRCGHDCGRPTWIYVCKMDKEDKRLALMHEVMRPDLSPYERYDEAWNSR